MFELTMAADVQAVTAVGVAQRLVEADDDGKESSCVEFGDGES